MTTHKQIEREKRCIASCEKSLALQKLKKRKADTRHKIELGGLVIKSGMNQFNKFTILGALNYIFELMIQDVSLVNRFQIKGRYLLKKNCS
ncbi:TPA: conjugal transfer protein TraD [Legionella pneumophila]|uniref:conjugal transfer protein TraD n=1 Tax=Legionella pneumophila TaxID=446 RepID=UPI000787C4F4|nr:conjugal transfer protein TraD [Legionella pneumophila]HAU1190892.1 conjugal transfer protein TraD [Legionella pneumophila]HBD7101604.1 conjugal transfer protein TraD [Legionella pneumophila]HBD7170696.1 conjugal transfer protein TraD [Legionella pneumophila]HCO4738110.1 conjugal transfer protein TraD [Legionella pneumophila]HEG4428819.1 conjugal transfer protein TraD [Legionella pneumophila]